MPSTKMAHDTQRLNRSGGNLVGRRRKFTREERIRASFSLESATWVLRSCDLGLVLGSRRWEMNSTPFVLKIHLFIG